MSTLILKNKATALYSNGKTGTYSTTPTKAKYRLHVHWKHSFSERSEAIQFIFIPTSTTLHRSNLGISFGVYWDILFLDKRGNMQKKWKEQMRREGNQYTASKWRGVLFAVALTKTDN